MIRKAAIQICACALFAFIAMNAFLAVKQLRQLQKDAALSLDSSMIQADISSILKDMTDMETGQRGYLLTADPSYLQPYNDAKSRIESDFASLRTRFRNRSEREQAMQSELES